MMKVRLRNSRLFSGQCGKGLIVARGVAVDIERSEVVTDGVDADAAFRRVVLGPPRVARGATSGGEHKMMVSCSGWQSIYILPPASL